MSGKLKLSIQTEQITAPSFSIGTPTTQNKTGGFVSHCFDSIRIYLESLCHALPGETTLMTATARYMNTSGKYTSKVYKWF